MLENPRRADVLPFSKVRKLPLCIQENLTIVGHGETHIVIIATTISMLCLLAFFGKKSCVLLFLMAARRNIK